MLNKFYKQSQIFFKNSPAFTILEVLVVLSIFIVIIGAVAVPHIDKMFLKVKSTQRVHDVETIQTALNFYKQENGFYPNDVTFGEPLIGVNGKTYLTKVPVSFQDAVCNTPFVYATTSNGISYNLDFCVSAKLDKVDVGSCVAVPGNLCCRRVCDATKVCGDDGCGKSCGACDNGQICSNNTCVSCVGSCDGRECGSDGCTGSCGSPCLDSKICAAGRCKSYNPDMVSRVIVADNFSVRSVKMSQDGSVIYAIPNLAKTIMKSADAGTTWTLVTSSLFISDFPFGSLETDNTGQKIALVDNDNYLFLSSDGGTSWTRKDFFKTSGYVCANLKANYSFNYLGCNSTGNYLAQSNDSGNKWALSTESIQAFDVSDNKVVANYALCDGVPNCNLGYHVYNYYSNDSGSTFTASSSSSRTDPSGNFNPRIFSLDSKPVIKNISVSDDGNNVLEDVFDAQGAFKALYVSTDGAASYNRIATSTGEKFSKSILTPSGNKIISADYDTLKLYQSDIQGSNWNAYNTYSTSFSDFVTDSDASNLLLYNGKYGEALLSTDSGNNFNDLKLDMPRDWMGCGISYDGTHMVIGESGGWHYSKDGGNSFQLLDYKTGLSLSTSYETNPGLTITDNGKLFTPTKFVDLTTNTVSSITGVTGVRSGAASRNGQIIYLATNTSNKPLKKSVDSGSTWSDTASISGAVNANSLMGISSDGSKILLCGSSPSKPQLSTDYGSTWSSLTSYPSLCVNGLRLYISDDGLVLASSLGYISRNGGISWSSAGVTRINSMSRDGSVIIGSDYNGAVYIITYDGLTATKRMIFTNPESVYTVNGNLVNCAVISGDGSKLLIAAPGGYVYTATPE